MEGYSVIIKESSREFTPRERLMLKDKSNAIRLDAEITADTPMVIQPEAYAILSIHNEMSDNVDYENYMVIDKAGNKYVTGSASFWNSFKSIWDEMKEEGEDYSIEVYKMESKNYKGKQFITCSIV